jgi:hypothetical protein
MCHVALWLWIAEISRMIGSFLGKFIGVDSFSYFGSSMEAILWLGALFEMIGMGIFELFVSD